MHLKAALLAATACASAFIPAVAAAEPNQLQEIIVTARKRQESLLNVPVVETAIAQQQLQRLQTQDLKALSTMVPGLLLGTAVLSVGTQVSLRGIGTSSLDAGVDQSVALNIDGLQLTQGLAYSAGMFDVGQVEVLKGPQALFYGKNSPGGVISIRTADPTDRFEVIARAAHEFEAQENRAELIVSGPVTDSLKLRLATMYDHQEGYFTNPATPAPGTGAAAPANLRSNPDTNYVIRGTALWAPSKQFDARLKLNYSHDRADDAGGMQLASCPNGLGAPLGIQFIGGGDCKIDRTIYYVAMDPSNFIGIRNGGQPFIETSQAFGTLEMNYHPRADLTLTSTTGYYNLRSDSLINGTETGFAGTTLSADNHFKRHDLTQELRANSDFAGPLNFTAGAYVQSAELTNLVTLLGNTAYGLPPVLSKGSHDLKIDSQSLFGQVRYKLVSNLEVAFGARWTHERRTDSPINLMGPTPEPVALAVPKVESNNVSPELTITYRPTDDVTVFGSLKKAYKSGSFTVTTPVFDGSDNAFGDEKVQGGEIGVKSRWLDRRLALNIAGYDYHYTGLQTSANEIAANGLPQELTLNAGSALIYGVDFDVAYRPELIEGLGLHGSINWNKARFQTLNNVPCYGGQTIAAGCDQQLNTATGLYTSQSLSGAPLVRAPDWQTNFGFDYQTDIGNDLTLVFASNTLFTSKYLTDLGARPDYYQKSFFKTDMSVTLQGPKDRWEFAVIGKNLTDRLTTGNCTNLNYQGGQILGGQVTGGTGRGPAGIDSLVCQVDRGREIWVRLTLKPFN